MRKTETRETLVGGEIDEKTLENLHKIRQNEILIRDSGTSRNASDFSKVSAATKDPCRIYVSGGHVQRTLLHTFY